MSLIHFALREASLSFPFLPFHYPAYEQNPRTKHRPHPQPDRVNQKSSTRPIGEFIPIIETIANCPLFRNIFSRALERTSSANRVQATDGIDYTELVIESTE